MTIQCNAIAKSGAQCKRNAGADSVFCSAHLAANAPINEEAVTMEAIPTIPTESASIVESIPTMAQSPALPETTIPTKAQTDKENARQQWIARQQKKSTAIANNVRLNGDQKALIGVIVAKETQNRALVTPGAVQSDQRIAAYDDLIATSKAKNKEPIALNVRPVWLGEKDWKKACVSYKRTYTTSNPDDSFDVDTDGRYVLPLPLTAGRYTAMIATLDATNVLRYSGSLNVNDGYTMVRDLDGVAPIVANVYRAGAVFNSAITKLSKAIDAVDTADTSKLDKAIERRDSARKARDLAATAFLSTYLIAVKGMPHITASAETLRAELLAKIACDQADLLKDTIGNVIDTASSFVQKVEVSA